MFPLITTKIKDDTLHWLCHNVQISRMVLIDHPNLLETVNVDFDTVHAVLDDFQELGLIESLSASRNRAIYLILKVRAHTFFQQGGFAVEDALNEANIQKILFDLELLQKQIKSNPDQLETFNKLAAIGSALTTILAAFSGKN